MAKLPRRVKAHFAEAFFACGFCVFDLLCFQVFADFERGHIVALELQSFRAEHLLGLYALNYFADSCIILLQCAVMRSTLYSVEEMDMANLAKITLRQAKALALKADGPFSCDISARECEAPFYGLSTVYAAFGRAYIVAPWNDRHIYGTVAMSAMHPREAA